MDRAMFQHNVTVLRNTGGILEGWAVIISSQPCLIEAMPAKSHESIMGRIPDARYVMTWPNSPLLDGDRVIVNTGPPLAVNSTFILAEIRDDGSCYGISNQRGILRMLKR